MLSEAIIAFSCLNEELSLLEGIAGGEISRYNGFNQLVETTLDDVTASYAYAPSGLRTSKTVGGTTTKFVLDGSNVALEMQGSSVTGRYVRGFDLVQSTKDGIKAVTNKLFDSMDGDVLDRLKEEFGLEFNY